MSSAQNLAYTAIQTAHNFGAVATVGSSFAGILIREGGARKVLIRFLLTGWAIQAVSGVAFGATSYYFYGRFPDIAGVAMAALVIKVGCVVTGFFLVGAALVSPSPARMNWLWPASTTLAAIALTSAAFLRWFS